MSKNIFICGVGGQGTVLAAKVISQVALSRGEKVLSAETIGMAQRGGCVVSHVRIGNDVYSPLIPEGQADIIIAFEASEAVRNIKYLKKDGIVVVNKSVIQPITASLNEKNFNTEQMMSYIKKISKNVISVDTDEACRKLGSTKIVNMLLLGAACNKNLFSKEEIKKSTKILVKPMFYELNEKAIDYTF